MQEDIFSWLKFKEQKCLQLFVNDSQIRKPGQLLDTTHTFCSNFVKPHSKVSKTVYCEPCFHWGMHIKLWNKMTVFESRKGDLTEFFVMNTISCSMKNNLWQTKKRRKHTKDSKKKEMKSPNASSLCNLPYSHVSFLPVQQWSCRYL